MNKLLQRQIKKNFGDTNNVPPALLHFLQVISDAYDGFDQDRGLAERSIELSSQELLEANQQLRKESEGQKAILADLRKATAALMPHKANPSGWLTSKDETVYLANSLSKLIEQEKQHVKELEQSKLRTEQEKAKAEAILKSIGDGVFAVNLEGRIMLMNAVAEDLSGFTFNEGQGKHYREIFRFAKEKDPSSLYPSFIEDVIKTGTIKTLENHTMLINRRAVKIPISDSAAPIKDEKGEVFGCIVVIRDASRERQLEQTKDEFISIVAHQLRSPLGSIRWNIEMILRQPNISDKFNNKIKRIYQSNRRLIALVNDLLNVSIIEQGMVKETPHPTDVLKVLRSAVLEIEPEAQKHKVFITIQSQGKHTSKIMIDPKRLREVIQNLLSNAVAYNVPGGKVTVVVQNIGESIKISVKDQGIGIPKKDQPRLFSKFYRADNAVRRDTTGSGLGLFVVKSYVERWGGKISFESTENKGTTFHIELPIKIKRG
jgi:two-component system phosphate regulon sensor histidine kinase PhoR